MALTFAADGDRVVTSGAGIASPSAGTFCQWFYPTDNAARQTLFRLNGAGEFDVVFRADQANDPLQCGRQRSSTYATAYANTANFAAFGYSKWLFLVFCWDTAGASAAQRLLIGDVTTQPAEPSAYSSQAEGSGTTDNSVGHCEMGNTATATWVREFHGRIQTAAIWNRILSSAEILSQWRQMKPLSGCLGFWVLGRNGVNSQFDYSGNGNAGTVTSATVGDDPSRLPFAPMRAWGYIPGAAPAGRTTKNTRPNPLGIEVGMGWQMSIRRVDY